ncbi:carbonic anhydrase 4-like [Clavelina lepadiformis]|uniref:carbonic anhydrase 4-like n=1 Tax=Clavelina lepadiformis TaxID=159417 RepID=UPI0040411AB4
MEVRNFMTSFLLLVCLTSLGKSADKVRRMNTHRGQECFGKSSMIINGKEYQLFNEKANYDEAKVKCEKWGAKWMSARASLATIPDQETQECLSDMIRSPGNYQPKDWRRQPPFEIGYTIGGTDQREGSWKWATGDPIHTRGKKPGYSNWGRFEPNDWRRFSGEGEDCMSMLLRGVPGLIGYERGKWIDHLCSVKMFFICERDLPDSDFGWGFPNNAHTLLPSDWPNKYVTCGGSHQSPVDVDITTNRFCSNDLSTVTSWGTEHSEEVQWVVHNTGRNLEIRLQPERSLYSTFHGSDVKHYVEKIHIKFGDSGYRGSEHSIGGKVYAGELQIFHHPAEETEERHALSFMLQERYFQPNRRWSKLLRHINTVQEADMTSVMKSPEGHFKYLLGDTARSNDYRSEEYVTGAAVRYRGSLTQPPCTDDVIWTVYPRAITLSFAQFSVLRHLNMEGGQPMKGNTRPLQPRSDDHCIVLS